MTIGNDIAAIVGPEYITDEPETLERYSRDSSFVTPRRPGYVAFPKDVEEVQGIVKYANENRISVTPRSSRTGFYGAGIPYQSGIIVDLSRMNKILEIDGPDKRVKIEPGVTWAQLQEELEKNGLMVCSPLLPHPLNSALTSSMERDPILIPKSEYNDTLLTTQLVLPSGDLFFTGTAMGSGMKSQVFPESIIPGNTKLFQGAQGTLGIITWANIKAEWIPAMDKLFFIPFEKAEELAEPIYSIQRRMLGSECFALNGFNLSTILAEKWPDDFEKLRASLPPYVLLFCASGFHIFPEGKIEYEEEALMEIASELGFEALSTVADIPGLGEKLLKMLRKPWQRDEYWKFRYKSACHDIFFYTTLNRVAEFSQAIYDLADRHEYPAEDIGFYLQPVERGRACFCQYSFPASPGNEREVSQVRNLYLEASEKAISMGGVFTRPYGPWADMVYSRAGNYTFLMKTVKNAFDPRDIMNPGKLCF